MFLEDFFEQSGEAMNEELLVGLVKGGQMMKEKVRRNAFGHGILG